jgi:hypothetical protein
MSDANSAPAVTVPGEAKVSAALNALWIGGAAAPEPDIVARAFELIVEAAKSASRLNQAPNNAISHSRFQRPPRSFPPPCPYYRRRRRAKSA